MVGPPVGERLTTSATAPADALPPFATLHRAPNPGPMTLDGTNTWVLRAAGHAETVVVDPGPPDEEHLRAVAGEPGTVALVLITHGHPDHVEGLARFRELVPDAPVRAVDAGYGTPLRDGEVLAAAGLSLEVLRTPGHTADSACFLIRSEGARAVLTGDTVLGRGTTVVAWPDGDLTAYLASLARLARLSGVPALPGHGPPLADCAAAARYYLAHRNARLEQVRMAVEAGADTPGAVIRRVYPDLEPAVLPAAELTVRAALAHLRRAPASDREHNDPSGGLDST